jgi:polar amino acid transport system substrate-binding protein
MFISRRGFVTSLVAGSPLFAHAKDRPFLQMVNTVYPPFVNPPNDPSGEGLDVDIARLALDRAGFDMRIEYLPWKRALLKLEEGSADLISTISRREDRNRFLDWSLPYRMGAEYKFFGLRDSRITLVQLADLKDKNIGLVAGFHYPGSILDSGATFFYARDVNMLVKMLHAKRIEMFVATGIAGEWGINSLGLGSYIVALPYVYTSTSPNYLAFSRKSELAMKALPNVKVTLRRMLEQGEIQKLERRYNIGS